MLEAAYPVSLEEPYKAAIEEPCKAAVASSMAVSVASSVVVPVASSVGLAVASFMVVVTYQAIADTTSSMVASLAITTSSVDSIQALVLPEQIKAVV